MEYKAMKIWKKGAFVAMAVGLAAIVGGVALMRYEKTPTNSEYARYVENYIEQNCSNEGDGYKKEMLELYLDFQKLPEEEFNRLVNEYDRNLVESGMSKKEELQKLFPWIKGKPHKMDKAVIAEYLRDLKDLEFGQWVVP